MKAYLGDAVYVEWNGFALVLTTSDGYRQTNHIVLEPPVYNALVRFVQQLGGEPASSDDEATDDA